MSSPSWCNRSSSRARPDRMWRRSPFADGRPSLRRQSRDDARLPGQLEDVHSRAGEIDDVDVAAVVDLGIVGLDRDLAAVQTVHLDATLLRRFRNGRDEISDFLWLEGIAHIEHAQARVEPADEHEFLIVNR